MAQDATLRVFFALWPDRALRNRLFDLATRMRRTCGGRATRPENLHLTLVFVGAVAPARLPDIRASAEEVHVPSFSLALSVPGYWAGKRIAWVAPSDPPRALFDLVAALERGLIERGFTLETRPYFPHLTLLRHARCGQGAGPVPEPIPELSWAVTEFVLVSSRLEENGACYEEIGRWPLSGAPSVS